MCNGNNFIDRKCIYVCLLFCHRFFWCWSLVWNVCLFFFLLFVFYDSKQALYKTNILVAEQTMVENAFILVFCFQFFLSYFYGQFMEKMVWMDECDKYKEIHLNENRDINSQKMCFYRFILNGPSHTQCDFFSIVCIVWYSYSKLKITYKTQFVRLNGQFTRRDTIDIKIRKKQSCILLLIFSFDCIVFQQ